MNAEVKSTDWLVSESAALLARHQDDREIRQLEAQVRRMLRGRPIPERSPAEAHARVEALSLRIVAGLRELDAGLGVIEARCDELSRKVSLLKSDFAELHSCFREKSEWARQMERSMDRLQTHVLQLLQLEQEEELREHEERLRALEAKLKE